MFKMRKNISLFGAMAMATVFAFAMSTNLSYAAVSTSGCAGAISCTLAELDSGGSITIDDTTFSSWSVDVNDSSATAADLSNVTVTGDDTDPVNPVLIYNGTGEWAATGTADDFSQTTWSFTLTDDTATNNLKDNTLILGTFIVDDTGSPGIAGTGGVVDIQEEVCPQAGCGAFTDDPFALKSAFSDNGAVVEHLNDPVTFDTQENQIFVTTEVFLSADDASNVVTLDTFQQQFSLVVAPSPLTCPECDLNNDGAVNFGDLSAVFPCMGQTSPLSPPCDVADVNGDGIVNFNDVSLIVSNFT